LARARVLADVEQVLVLVHAQLLPVVLARSPLVAVLHAPEHRSLVPRLQTAQVLEHRHAVEGMVRRRRNAGDGQHGDGPVHGQAVRLGHCAPRDAIPCGPCTM
jgi:hypothetical protein